MYLKKLLFVMIETEVYMKEVIHEIKILLTVYIYYYLEKYCSKFK